MLGSALVDEQNPCVMAFIAGPIGTATDEKQLAGYLEGRTKNVKGWMAADDIQQGGWKNKVGYIATRPNATTTFVVPRTHIRVKSVRLFSLKSYGEKWANSKARFVLRGIAPGTNEVVAESSFEVEGFHDSNTSISFAYDHNVDEEKSIPRGYRLELRVDLVGGTTFKITGLTVCAWQ